MRTQRIVAAFVEEHDLEGTPEYRLLDVDAEAALDESIRKYERRMAASGDASSTSGDASSASGDTSSASGAGDADARSGVATTRYNKLVRDDIPGIIRESGDTLITRVADDREYADLLGEKLVEEAREFRESGDTEELADVLAVVDAVREHRDVSEDELRDLQTEKAAERGRFEDRIVLEAVEE